MFEARMAINGLDLLCWCIAGLCIWALYKIELWEAGQDEKKSVKARFRPIHTTSLTEGVIKEMSRYDGGYEKVERGPILGRIHTDPDGDYYEWIEVTGKNVNLQRWLSFGARMESLETI